MRPQTDSTVVIPATVKLHTNDGVVRIWDEDSIEEVIFSLSLNNG
jgi:hypothetical protein